MLNTVLQENTSQLEVTIPIFIFMIPRMIMLFLESALSIVPQLLALIGVRMKLTLDQYVMLMNFCSSTSPHATKTPLEHQTPPVLNGALNTASSDGSLMEFSPRELMELTSMELI